MLLGLAEVHIRYIVAEKSVTFILVIFGFTDKSTVTSGLSFVVVAVAALKGNSVSNPRVFVLCRFAEAVCPCDVAVSVKLNFVSVCARLNVPPEPPVAVKLIPSSPVPYLRPPKTITRIPPFVSPALTSCCVAVKVVSGLLTMKLMVLEKGLFADPTFTVPEKVTGVGVVPVTSV